MSVYHEKLLELLSIEKTSDQAFLRMKLSFKKEVELLWEIDIDTARKLQVLTDAGNHYKFRLSFYHSWNTTKKQSLSYVTKTYRNESERVYFSCSEKYVKGLQAIKSVSDIDEVYALPDVTVHDPVQSEEPVQKEPESSNNRLTLIAVAVLSAAFIFLLGYSGYDHISQPVYGEEANVIYESPEKEILLKSKREVLLSSSGNYETNAITERNMPAIEVTGLQTFTIPQGSVALTFDDGPTLNTIKITDILNEYQVGGTFFFTGIKIQKHPGYVQYVHENGYSIGNHSMTHVNMNRLNRDEQEKELVVTSELIEELIHEPVELFRPPYGAYNEKTIDLMEEHDHKMVLWDIDPEDWRSRSAEAIINQIHKNDVSGSIILLHESQAVVDALPDIIEYLQEQDLDIVNIK